MVTASELQGDTASSPADTAPLNKQLCIHRECLVTFSRGTNGRVPGAAGSAAVDTGRLARGGSAVSNRK